MEKSLGIILFVLALGLLIAIVGKILFLSLVTLLGVLVIVIASILGLIHTVKNG